MTLSERPESFLSERQYCFAGIFFKLDFHIKTPRGQLAFKVYILRSDRYSSHISSTLNAFWNQDQYDCTELHLETAEFSHALMRKEEQINCSQLCQD